MYVGYMLDKEGSMYPTPVRRPNINVSSTQNFASGPQYSEYSGYHVPAMESHPQPTPMAWNPPYGPPREDWGPYGLGPANPVPVQISHSTSPGQMPYGGLPPPDPHQTPGQPSPNGQRRNPYEWMKKSSQISAAGKTRTKDKYRVVYTDHQRLELEKEFHYNRYITIKRKSELATILGLSERQVKIWFQNRRAKERKITKKQMAQSEACPPQHGPVSGSPEEIAAQMMVGNQIPGGQSVGNMPQVTVTL
uniref:Caudal type homeobox 4 n=1 Tax=Callorhinchus milii TaxID=7868 RepID=A0A4W3JGT1_CALMI